MKQPILDLDVKVAQLCENINEAYQKEWDMPETNHVAKYGKKYIKIVKTVSGQDNNVWGFINISNENFRYGDVLKASTFNKPALNQARGNIIDHDYEISANRLYGPDYLR